MSLLQRLEMHVFHISSIATERIKYCHLGDAARPKFLSWGIPKQRPFPCIRVPRIQEVLSERNLGTKAWCSVLEEALSRYSGGLISYASPAKLASELPKKTI